MTRMTRLLRDAVAFAVVGVLWLLPGMVVGIGVLMAIKHWPWA